MSIESDFPKLEGFRQANEFREKRKARRISIACAAAQIGVWDQTLVDFEFGRLPLGLSKEEFERWMRALDVDESTIDEFRKLRRRMRTGELLKEYMRRGNDE